MGNLHQLHQPSYYPKKKSNELIRSSERQIKHGSIAPAIAAALLFVKPL